MALVTSRDLTFLNLEEIEAQARDLLPPMVMSYYAGGADSEYTVRENRAIFSRYRFVPRILRDVSCLSTVSKLFGLDLSYPVMIAPMAMHGMAHPDRELATARAAKATGVPFVFSTMATASLDEVAGVGHRATIFQLYVIRDHNVVRSWVQRAEALGFKALMITVDAPRLGHREADERNSFALPDGLELKNLAVLAYNDSTQARNTRRDDTDSGIRAVFRDQVDDSLTWEFISWLRTITKLPIIIKGLLSPDDAVLAVQYGVDGVVVSNHGGRQLDHTPSGIEMLPAIVAVVKGRMPVMVDGGIRRGTDILKALALGADAVLVGRPVLYGLALGGQAGVERVLNLLRKEFELAMALSGCSSLSDITPFLLLQPSSKL